MQVRDRYGKSRVVVEDNGPGIVEGQIARIFGKLLYGSKFHKLSQSRGQQGMGISAAGMYGQLTVGKPLHIISRVEGEALASEMYFSIDTAKNRPDTSCRHAEAGPPSPQSPITCASLCRRSAYSLRALRRARSSAGVATGTTLNAGFETRSSSESPFVGQVLEEPAQQVARRVLADGEHVVRRRDRQLLREEPEAVVLLAAAGRAGRSRCAART